MLDEEKLIRVNTSRKMEEEEIHPEAGTKHVVARLVAEIAERRA